MIIDLYNVSWKRGQRMILQHINWTVKEKEHWCILGLNGSGKTTLLEMINGYIWPTTGKITVLGHPFGEYDLRELRKSIGWVSTAMQQKFYASEQALQIVLSGKFATIGVYDQIEDADMAKAAALMEKLGCAALMERTFNTLSQGERQRVLIARALMGDPKLLILDEPCTGLDLFAREQLLKMIETIAVQENGPTLLYVTHHIEEILPCFTGTLLLKQGQVFASGASEDMLESDMMSDFFDVPVHIVRESGRNWLSVKGQSWK